MNDSLQIDLGGDDDVMTSRDFRLLMTRKATPMKAIPRTTPLRNKLRSGRYGGTLRCAAVGLIRGDCSEYAGSDSIYCYYHDKVREGLVEVYQDLYPVWPLPDFPWEISYESVRLAA